MTMSQAAIDQAITRLVAPLIFEADEAWTRAHSGASQQSPNRAPKPIGANSRRDIAHVRAPPRGVVHLLTRRQHADRSRARREARNRERPGERRRESVRKKTRIGNGENRRGRVVGEETGGKSVEERGGGVPMSVPISAQDSFGAPVAQIARPVMVASAIAAVAKDAKI